jgi:hypothetical protein
MRVRVGGSLWCAEGSTGFWTGASGVGRPALAPPWCTSHFRDEQGGWGLARASLD